MYGVYEAILKLVCELNLARDFFNRGVYDANCLSEILPDISDRLQFLLQSLLLLSNWWFINFLSLVL